jgi:DNA repair protein RadC
MVFKGSVDNVLISPRVILAKALSLNASNIILYHNHPSGSVKPSASDIKMTNNLKKACTLLEVNLIDHLILSREECYSFADEASFKVKK